jgi:hypothetical protein
MSTRTIGRALPWLGGLVLVAGLVAFGTVYLFGSDDPVEVAPPVETATSEPTAPGERQNVVLDPKAREAAGRFILTAVTRQDLAASYALAHPELKAGYTLEEWKTGNIPVQYYPADAIDTATFKIDESYANEAVLEVALLPKKNATVKPQIFYIGLKKLNGKWLVYYWAPRAAIPVPVAD